MEEEKIQRLIAFIKGEEEKAECFEIAPSQLIFEENVKMNCFYCGKYGNNWRCPPHLPDLDYKKMMAEFDHGLFVKMEYELTEDNYSLIRNDSSITLHKLLLSAEKWLYNNNSSNALSFIGGSCKLCKNGCGKERCNNPYMSRSPLEATGVNIVKSAKLCGINICFPTKDTMMRIGLLLWQNE